MNCTTVICKIIGQFFCSCIHSHCNMTLELYLVLGSILHSLNWSWHCNLPWIRECDRWNIVPTSSIGLQRPYTQKPLWKTCLATTETETSKILPEDENDMAQPTLSPTPHTQQPPILQGTASLLSAGMWMSPAEIWRTVHLCSGLADPQISELTIDVLRHQVPARCVLH